MLDKKILKEILISANEGLTIFDYYNENVNTNLMDFNKLKEIFNYYLEKGIIDIYYKDKQLVSYEREKILNNENNWNKIFSDYNVVLTKRGFKYLNKANYTEEDKKILFPNF